MESFITDAVSAAGVVAVLATGFLVCAVAAMQKKTVKIISLNIQLK
jgi:hypothetical protein